MQHPHHEELFCRRLQPEFVKGFCPYSFIVTFTKEAYRYVLSSTKTQSCVVEYYDIPDASLITGNRQQRLDGYREVRDILTKKLYQRLFDYL